MEPPTEGFAAGSSPPARNLIRVHLDGPTALKAALAASVYSPFSASFASLVGETDQDAEDRARSWWLSSCGLSKVACENDISDGNYV